jgi:hypothetical protein
LQLGGANRLGPRPNALRRLARELEKRTSIAVQVDPVVVTPTSDTLHETPFLYLAGERELELPSAAGIAALRRFLTFGGFLLVDSAEGSTDGAFDGAVRKIGGVSIAGKGPRARRAITWSTSRSTCSIVRSAAAIAPAMEAVIRDGRIVVIVANELAVRGRATTSATTSSAASPAASASASSRSAWA